MRKIKKTQLKELPRHLGIYIRVSSDKQVESGISLRDQEERGINKAKELKWSYEIFQDAGMSGTLSFKDRPRFFELMNQIDDNTIGGVWVVDIDRLNRSEEGQVLISTLKSSGIKIFENGVEKDLSNPETEALIRMKSIFATLEVQKMKQRLEKALLKNARDGVVGGGPLQPYGYKKENKRLVIDEKESEILKQIFKMSLDGNGTRSIANYLNENNVPTKRAGADKGQLKVRGEVKTNFTWKDGTIYSILTNTIYKGERKYKNIIVESPIIVEPKVFDLVQQNLKTKNRFKKDKKYFYLLKGLVSCGNPKCRGSFYGKKREDLKDEQYTCISSRDKKGYCGNRGINIDKLNDLVWNQITDLPSQIKKFFNWYEKTDQIKQVKKEYEILLNFLKEKETEYANLLVMGAKGTIKENILDKQIEFYNNKIDWAKERIKEVSPQLTILDNRESIENIIGIYVERTKKKSITDDEKQQILRNLVDRVYVTWQDNSDKRPSPILMPKHNIKIVYKIDALSSFRLSNDIEIGYKKHGWRMESKGILSNDLMITQNFSDIVNVQKHFGFNPVKDVVIK